LTVGELTLRGCYLGSNVSYNLKKMVENKYLAHERSVHDRRSDDINNVQAVMLFNIGDAEMELRHRSQPPSWTLR
jgi:hypothetical protein